MAFSDENSKRVGCHMSRTAGRRRVHTRTLLRVRICAVFQSPYGSGGSDAKRSGGLRRVSAPKMPGFIVRYFIVVPMRMR